MNDVSNEEMDKLIPIVNKLQDAVSARAALHRVDRQQGKDLT